MWDLGWGKSRLSTPGQGWRVSPGTEGCPLAQCPLAGQAGLPAGDVCTSPRALRWGSCSAPSGSVSPLRAQGALHLGGLQQGLALLQLKPLELKQGSCCRDMRTPVAILWRHPS